MFMWDQGLGGLRLVVLINDKLPRDLALQFSISDIHSNSNFIKQFSFYIYIILYIFILAQRLYNFALLQLCTR